MLGSTSEADDAVQEAWIRLSRSNAGEIDNLEAWLATVVGRVAPNVLRSRKTRRELPLDVLYLHGAGWQAHVEDLGRYLAGGQSMWKARWEELTPAYQSLGLS
jgi:DNA-directed RNA polymerase specialized sigma24 family protein